MKEKIHKLLFATITLALIVHGPFSLAASQSEILPLLKETDALRVLYYQEALETSAINDRERSLLEQFSSEYGLDLQLITVDKPWQLIPELLKGKGNIIAGQGEHLMAGMQDQARFTLPWGINRLQLITRSDAKHIDNPEKIIFRQVTVKKSSVAWSQLEQLAKTSPTMSLIAIPEDINNHEIFTRMISGEYDVTIMDSNYLASSLPQYPELKVAFNLSAPSTRAWAVHPKSTQLLIALDQFLNKNHLSLSIANVRLQDLPNIQNNKLLRVITYQNPKNYYLHKGKLRGFEYALVERFARQRNMRVEMVLAKSHREMQELLLQGQGDIIAASLPVDSFVDKPLRMSVAYDYSEPIIIGRSGEKRLLDFRDLGSRRIALPPESPYRNCLKIPRKAV